jgi:hypothetical protein
MASILYIFPHPDDESFGPASAISAQLRRGNEVHLLTLTKGGATKVRHDMNLSIEEMGEVRHKEMLDVEKALNLSSMHVLDLPDSGLKHMDPRVLERAIEEQIIAFNPEIIVTYPVHGISGFHDHLICHYAVKRVFVGLKEKHDLRLKRLAFFTFDEDTISGNDGKHSLSYSDKEEIDCIEPLEEQDIQNLKEGLSCYVSYKKVIENSIDKMPLPRYACFEIFNESFKTPLKRIEDLLH